MTTSRPPEFGVFLPVANGGWIISSATPPLDGLWKQNLAAAQTADRHDEPVHQRQPGRFELLRWPPDAPMGIGVGGRVGVHVGASVGVPVGISVRAGVTREPEMSVDGPTLHPPAWPEAVRQF